MTRIPHTIHLVVTRLTIERPANLGVICHVDQSVYRYQCITPGLARMIWLGSGAKSDQFDSDTVDFYTKVSLVSRIFRLYTCCMNLLERLFKCSPRKGETGSDLFFEGSPWG
jgi:hypothetical protein